MADGLRLDRYLARIGMTGAAEPTFATLATIQAAQVDAIPFEGLDPLLRRPVKLDLASVQEKLVDGRRGGYCFEQNALLKAALDTIGFAVTGLSGRVRWMSPPDSPMGPREHMLLKVDMADGPYLVDAGFGACLIDRPLRLETGLEQRTAMGTYLLSEADGLFWLRAKQPDGWRIMYAFDLAPQIQADYELGNWYTSTHPGVPFTNIAIMERLAPDRRYKLINRNLKTEARDGEVLSEAPIRSAEEFHKVLDETFGVTPPASAAQIFSLIGADPMR